MRRLPIYFLVDTCFSMTGKPIEKVENCINAAVKCLKANPFAIEIAALSVIAYGNNKVSVLETYKNLTEISDQNFDCSGFSNINYGLEAVKENYNRNFIPTTIEKKGDWKPMLFVFTGIAPNTKIDSTLISFFEEKFSHGYIDYIDSSLKIDVSGECQDQSTKAKFTIIVTSENVFARKSFQDYFTEVYSYEDLDSFINKFNNFFKCTS
jgi:uncharacterized protein YegL